MFNPNIRQKMKYQSKRGYIIMFIVIGFVIFSLITIFKKENNNLDVYNKSQRMDVDNKNGKKEKKDDIECTSYSDDKLNFVVEIPVGWEKVTKDGFDTFVHAPSSSSIQIQTLPYDPAINNIDDVSIQNQIAADGYAFSSFKRINSSSYQVMYQKQGESLYDYVETVYWSRDDIIKLKMIVVDDNYKDIEPYFSHVIDSFFWNAENPLPEKYCLTYFDYGNFEVGYPADWVTAVNDNVFTAVNESGEMTMTVSLMENPADVGQATRADLINVMAGERASFILNSFKQGTHDATAKATYVADNTQYACMQYLKSNGSFIYLVSIDAPADALDEKTATQCFKLVRDFKDKETTNQEKETNNDEQQTTSEQP